MSTRIRSTPLQPAGVRPAAAATAADATTLVTLQSNACNLSAQPFFMVRMRNFVQRSLQAFCLSPANFQQVADTVELDGLFADPQDSEGRALKVRAMYDDMASTTDRADVWVHVPAVNYEKLAMGSSNNLTPRMDQHLFTKAFNGVLQVHFDHRSHDVCTTFAEVLADFLEGVMHTKKQDLGLQTFDLRSVSDAVYIKQNEIQWMRATATFDFSGRYNLNVWTEGVTLKRVAVTLNAINPS
jgi:hypothetical protein